MEREIETEMIKPPSLRDLTVICPGCNRRLSETIGIDQTEGVIHCYSCGADFKWKLKDEQQSVP